MTRKLSFDAAKRLYVHRFTMDHTPAWARAELPTGKHYAPQYASDREWYELTLFPGESELSVKQCYSSGQTWPLGHWLDKPYSRAAFN